MVWTLENAHDELKSRLLKFKKEGQKSFVIGIDLGATNFRICFLDSTIKKLIREKHTLNNYTKYQNIQDALTFKKVLVEISKLFLEIFPKKDYPKCVKCSCIAIAGPVESDVTDLCIIPNYKEHKEFKLSELPEEIFPRGKTYAMNDVEAANYGIIESKDELGKLFETKNFFGSGENNKDDLKTLEKHSYFVVNMGSGLGTGIIHYSGVHHQHEVIPLEFGHINMFYTSNEKDLALYEEITKINQEKEKKKGFNQKYAPEAEDICSGEKGFGNLYSNKVRTSKDGDKSFIYEKSKHKDEHGDIGDLVKKNEDLNLYQFQKLCFLCQQVCVMFPRIKTLILCGNNVEKNFKNLQKWKGKLKESFTGVEHRISKGWVDDVKCYLQKNHVNLSLLGTFHYIGIKRNNN